MNRLVRGPCCLETILRTESSSFTGELQLCALGALERRGLAAASAVERRRLRRPLLHLSAACSGAGCGAAGLGFRRRRLLTGRRKKRRERASEREKIRGKISPPLPPFPCSIRREKFATKSIDLLDPIRRSVDRFARALRPPVFRSGRSRRR